MANDISSPPSSSIPKATAPGPSRVDVAIIGGGPAGLNAALVLGRARRSVIVVDGGDPRNGRADGVYGYLTRDGITPADLRNVALNEVRGYGVQVIHGEAVAATTAPDSFRLTLSDGGTVEARRLLIATGLIDQLPPVDGLAERWGRDVLHCPYCHGYEVRDRRIVVLGTDSRAVPQTLLMGQWTQDIVLVREPVVALTEDDSERLAARSVTVLEGTATSVTIHEDRLTGVRLASGEVVEADAVMVSPRFMARSAVAESLGLSVVDHVVATALPLDSDDKAGPGVWAVGNLTNPIATVVQAAADGARSAMAINADLVEEDVAVAVAASRRSASVSQ